MPNGQQYPTLMEAERKRRPWRPVVQPVERAAPQPQVQPQAPQWAQVQPYWEPSEPWRAEAPEAEPMVKVEVRQPPPVAEFEQVPQWMPTAPEMPYLPMMIPEGMRPTRPPTAGEYLGRGLGEVGRVIGPPIGAAAEAVGAAWRRLPEPVRRGLGGAAELVGKAAGPPLKGLGQLAYLPEQAMGEVQLRAQRAAPELFELPRKVLGPAEEWTYQKLRGLGLEVKALKPATVSPTAVTDRIGQLPPEQQEKATHQLARISYSGILDPMTQMQAMDEIDQAGGWDQATDEQITEILTRNQSWAAETIMRMIWDPLNVVQVFTAPFIRDVARPAVGKLIGKTRLGRWLTAPTLESTAKVAQYDTVDVMRRVLADVPEKQVPGTLAYFMSYPKVFTKKMTARGRMQADSIIEVLQQSGLKGKGLLGGHTGADDIADFLGQVVHDSVRKMAGAPRPTRGARLYANIKTLWVENVLGTRPGWFVNNAADNTVKLVVEGINPFTRLGPAIERYNAAYGKLEPIPAEVLRTFGQAVRAPRAERITLTEQLIGWPAKPITKVFQLNEKVERGARLRVYLHKFYGRLDDGWPALVDDLPLPGVSDDVAAALRRDLKGLTDLDASKINALLKQYDVELPSLIPTHGFADDSRILPPEIREQIAKALTAEVGDPAKLKGVEDLQAAVHDIFQQAQDDLLKTTEDFIEEIGPTPHDTYPVTEGLRVKPKQALINAQAEQELTEWIPGEPTAGDYAVKVLLEFSGADETGLWMTPEEMGQAAYEIGMWKARGKWWNNAFNKLRRTGKIADDVPTPSTMKMTEFRDWVDEYPEAAKTWQDYLTDKMAEQNTPTWQRIKDVVRGAPVEEVAAPAAPVAEEVVPEAARAAEAVAEVPPAAALVDRSKIARAGDYKARASFAAGQVEVHTWTGTKERANRLAEITFSVDEWPTNLADQQQMLARKLAEKYPADEWDAFERNLDPIHKAATEVMAGRAPARKPGVQRLRPPHAQPPTPLETGRAAAGVRPGELPGMPAVEAGVGRRITPMEVPETGTISPLFAGEEQVRGAEIVEAAGRAQLGLTGMPEEAVPAAVQQLQVDKWQREMYLQTLLEAKKEFPFGQETVNRIWNRFKNDFARSVKIRGKYVPWEYAIDDMATELGFTGHYGAEDLRNAVKNYIEMEGQINQTRTQITALEAQLRSYVPGALPLGPSGGLPVPTPQQILDAMNSIPPEDATRIIGPYLEELRKWEQAVIDALKGPLQARNQTAANRQAIRAAIAQAHAAGKELVGEAAQYATNETNRILFDYLRTGRLDALMQTIMPFWRWPSRNLPYWAWTFMEKPSLGASLQRLRDWQAEENQGLPPYLKYTVGIPGSEQFMRAVGYPDQDTQLRTDFWTILSIFSQIPGSTGSKEYRLKRAMEEPLDPASMWELMQQLGFSAWPHWEWMAGATGALGEQWRPRDLAPWEPLVRALFDADMMPTMWLREQLGMEPDVYLQRQITKEVRAQLMRGEEPDWEAAERLAKVKAAQSALVAQITGRPTYELTREEEARYDLTEELNMLVDRLVQETGGDVEAPKTNKWNWLRLQGLTGEGSPIDEWFTAHPVYSEILLTWKTEEERERAYLRDEIRQVTTATREEREAALRALPVGAPGEERGRIWEEAEAKIGEAEAKWEEAYPGEPLYEERLEPVEEQVNRLYRERMDKLTDEMPQYDASQYESYSDYMHSAYEPWLESLPERAVELWGRGTYEAHREEATPEGVQAFLKEKAGRNVTAAAEWVYREAFYAPYFGAETRRPTVVGLPGRVDWEGVNPRIARWAQHIEVAGQKYGIDPRIIGTIIEVESRGNPEVVNKAGAVGLMQVIHGGKIKGRPSVRDLQDPATNVDTGTAILADYLEGTDYNLQDALYQYSGGTAWSSRRRYESTYWSKIKSAFKGLWGTRLSELQQTAREAAQAPLERPGMDQIAQLVQQHFPQFTPEQIAQELEGREVLGPEEAWAARYPERAEVSAAQDSYWDEYNNSPPGFYLDALEALPEVQRVMQAGDRATLEDYRDAVAAMQEYKELNAPPGTPEEWAEARRLNDEVLRRGVYAQFGPEIYDIQNAYYAARDQARAAGQWGPEPPDILRAYWDFLHAFQDQYPVWTKYYRQPGAGGAYQARGRGGGGGWRRWEREEEPTWTEISQKLGPQVTRELLAYWRTGASMSAATIQALLAVMGDYDVPGWAGWLEFLRELFTAEFGTPLFQFKGRPQPTVRRIM